MTASRSRQRKRAAARAQAKAGVALVDRRRFSTAMLGKPDMLALNVGAAVARLFASGADVSRGHIAVTVGVDHPDFPGEVVIEAKAHAVKPRPEAADTRTEAHEEDCPGCPIAHDTGD